MIYVLSGDKAVTGGHLKPPDLWIHDQMEMKRASRSSSNPGGRSADDSTLPRNESDIDSGK